MQEGQLLIGRGGLKKVPVEGLVELGEGLAQLCALAGANAPSARWPVARDRPKCGGAGAGISGFVDESMVTAAQHQSVDGGAANSHHHVGSGAIGKQVARAQEPLVWIGWIMLVGRQQRLRLD